MITESFGKLYNAAGELVAEGSCLVDHEHGSVTLRPIIDTPLLSRQKGLLWLRCEDGSEFAITDRIIRFRLNVPSAPPGPAYRLYMQGAPGLRSTGSEGEGR